MVTFSTWYHIERLTHICQIGWQWFPRPGRLCRAHRCPTLWEQPGHSEEGLGTSLAAAATRSSYTGRATKRGEDGGEGGDKSLRNWQLFFEATGKRICYYGRKLCVFLALKKVKYRAVLCDFGGNVCFILLQKLSWWWRKMVWHTLKKLSETHEIVNLKSRRKN